MNRLILLPAFLSLLNFAHGQSTAPGIILGKWRSTLTYHKIPVRTLEFRPDSTYTETTTGSLGNFGLVAKYEFIDGNILILEDAPNIKAKINFIGKNIFRFLILQNNDSAADFMYKLKFRRQ